MPMQQARCPQCEAPIGGQSHNLAEGVRRTDEWDTAANDVGTQLGRMNL